MRNIKFILVVFAGLLGFFAEPIDAESRNYMGEAGTSWEYLCWSSDPFPGDTEESLMGADLLDAGEFLGKQTFGFGNLKTGVIAEEYRIYTEGDKVYFYNTEKESGWKLLFDFGLGVGEGVTVGALQFDDTFYVVCTERKEDKFNPGLTVMSMDVYSNKEDYEAGVNPWGNSPWIAGIGSLGDPFNPVCSIMLGVGFRLLRVTQGDKVIYRSEYGADVEEIAETERNVRIDHGEIAVEGASSIQLHDLNGRSYNAANGKFSNLAKGIYILRCGDQAHKIFVP